MMLVIYYYFLIWQIRLVIVRLMKKILVPTDFSPNAVRAIDYAVQIGRVNRAAIYLIHVCDHLYPVGSESSSKAEYNQKIASEAFAKLELLKKSIEEAEGVTVHTQIYSGDVKDSIIVAAEEHAVDVIIMGTMGITGVRDVIFGSKTASLIGQTTIPVLAIPLEYEWSVPQKLLIAINNFEEVTDILAPLFTLAKVFDAEVRVVVFTDSHISEKADFIADTRGIIYVEDLLRKMYAGIVVKAEHLSGSNFIETMNRYIESNHIDLLTMITHQRSFIGSIFNRSLTRKMSYHAKVPVLAVAAK